MFNAQGLQTYLYENIPISKHLGIQVKEASKHAITLWAPIVNNINHKKTVFGGSLQAVATLACWSLIHLNLSEMWSSIDIVITKSHIDYLLPITTDFEVTVILPEQPIWERFLKKLTLKGKSRLDLQINIYERGKAAVVYLGTFAAFRKLIEP